MKSALLGKSGLMVSRIGFGGLPIQRLTEPAAISVVKRCLELGVTLIDTAYDYTVSEEYIGKAIKGFDRSKLVLASRTRTRDYKEAKEHIKHSLKKLGTDYIDLYGLHNVSDQISFDTSMAENGAYIALKEAQKAGVIKHIGISSHSPDIAKTAVKCGYFETLTYPYSFVGNEPGENVLQLCREHNIGFMAMKPLGGGRLTNATLAIKYLLNVPDLVPVVGIERPEEIEEIAALEKEMGSLTGQDLLEIERIKKEVGTTFCRRCRYCLPCPEGIIIPIITNMVSMLKHDSPSMLFSPGAVERTMEKAKKCTECGECEKKCPYRLPIIEINKASVAMYYKAKAKYDTGVT
ncbi:MAG: aldo/keto reductase [Chloroflexi bacterium]|nr:aldo/keto reductase [Chloroflexota bacterium]